MASATAGTPSDSLVVGAAPPARSVAVAARESLAPPHSPRPDLRDVACRLERVHVRYGGVRALSSCTLDLMDGELTVVVGMPGSGRSTLARVVAGVDEVTLGRMWVDGIEAARVAHPAAVAHRRRAAALMLCTIDLTSRLTIVNHVLASLALDGFHGAHALGLAERALQRFGLARLEARRVARASHSELGRLGLAIAMAASPRLIVADDFGAGPEGDGARRADDRDVASALRASCRETGASAIVVSNDPVVATAADRVIALDEGHIVADRYGASTREIGDLLRGLATLAILRA